MGRRAQHRVSYLAIEMSEAALNNSSSASAAPAPRGAPPTSTGTCEKSSKAVHARPHRSPRRSASTLARTRLVEEPLTRPAGGHTSRKGKEREHSPHDDTSVSSEARGPARAPQPGQDWSTFEGRANGAAASETSPTAVPANPTASSENIETHNSLSSLLERLEDLPGQPSRQNFLDLRADAKALGALDDPTFVVRFALKANRSGCEDVGARLLRQSIGLLARQQDLSRADVGNLVEPVLADLVARKRWMAALQVSNALVTYGVVTPRLLVLRMRALSGRGRYADAVTTFENVGAAEDPSPEAFDLAINAHLCQANLAAAQALLAEKAQQGLATTADTYLLLLDGMDIFGGNHIMEEKMLAEGTEEQMRAGTAARQDVRILNRLMSLRAARGALREALSVLDLFAFDAYPPELLDAYRSLAIPALQPAASPTFPFPRPRPDPATVVVLTSIALRQQRPDLAEAALASGARAGVAMNDHLAAAAVRILLGRHDAAAAEAFVRNLPAGAAVLGGVPFPAMQPTSKILELLFSGMLRYRGVAGANTCFRQLLSAEGLAARATEGMTLALVEYLSATPVSGLGLSSKTLLQVQQLTQGGTRPDARHLDVLLKAAWQRDRLRRTAGAAEEPGSSEDAPSLADQPGPDGGEAPLSQPSVALPPTPAEAALVMKPPGGSSVASPVSRLRDSLADRDVRHSRETTRHIIRNDHLLRFIDAKWDYLQTQVIDLGIRPSYHHVTVLLRAYLRLGDTRGASNVLRYATRDLGLEPHVAYYSTLIAGLARLGKHAAVVRVYNEFRASGLEPDRNFFAALAMSHARRRDASAVERVLDEMRAFIRTRSPHPQLQAQSLKTAASASASIGFPPAILTPYDPLLDALFVTILYRAQVAVGRYSDAQELVARSLDRGMAPDPVLLKVLQRTRKWVRYKENQLEKSGRVAVRAGGTADIDLDRDGLEELKRANSFNIGRVRRMLRRMSPAIEKKEVQSLERYWQEVESGPDDDVEDLLSH